MSESSSDDYSESSEPSVEKKKPPPRTMTTEKRSIPVLKSTTLLKKRSDKEIEDSTLEFAKKRSYTPMWWRHIPTTLEDFENKEKSWKGFKYALHVIGLDAEEVRRRLTHGKPPWKDEEEQKAKCQKAYLEHTMKPPKTLSRVTAQAKTKVEKPQSQ